MRAAVHLSWRRRFEVCAGPGCATHASMVPARPPPRTPPPPLPAVRLRTHFPAPSHRMGSDRSGYGARSSVCGRCAHSGDRAAGGSRNDIPAREHGATVRDPVERHASTSAVAVVLDRFGAPERQVTRTTRSPSGRRSLTAERPSSACAARPHLRLGSGPASGSATRPRVGPRQCPCRTGRPPSRPRGLARRARNTASRSATASCIGRLQQHVDVSRLAGHPCLPSHERIRWRSTSDSSSPAVPGRVSGGTTTLHCVLWPVQAYPPTAAADVR